ncbi:MAG: ATPase [Ruminococcaceae bacterium]|nr:ATPase [Oscillospiraceae bacterium]
MDYIMGMSCADSVTHVNIATITGVVMQTFTVGAINLFCASEDEVAHNLAEAFVTAQLAGYPVKSCIQVCAGVAGLQGQETSVRLDPALRGVMRRCGYTGDALLIGDEQIALAGALEGKKGAILLSGNASACFGQNALGVQHRTGGLGQLADDDGSAYAIGREILRVVARASDGRGRLTHLTSHVYRKFSLAGRADLGRLLRSGTPTSDDICDLADSLSLACQVRDRVALDIVQRTVAQLIDLVEPVVKKLAMQKGTLAVAGQVLLNDAFVGVAFKKRISELYPELQCVPPRRDGAAGAVLLAKERLALRGFAR